ncbi:hypothetical protein AVEN_44118-1 [Araneus ventricosus]|uniref:Uncharacterized protein n=1 Tax=Araneus ventricosus TaxID=182803 RepID=A0A4Y2DC80_ARAVE|nr:hypothetical protein AVEN_44118-1 [Araneus ventricosus]
MERLQLACYGTSDTSRDDSDRGRCVSNLSITYTHLCPLCIPTNLDTSSRTVRHPICQESLPSSSRSTLLTLDTSIVRLNPQT